MRTLVYNRDFNIYLKKVISKFYIFPIVLYGIKAWTLSDKKCKSIITAFKMSLIDVYYIFHSIKNEEVLRRMNITPGLLYFIGKRQLEFPGHIMRNPRYELLQIIIQEKIEVKTGPGRRKNSWLKNLHKLFTSTEPFRTAVSNIHIVLLTAFDSRRWHKKKKIR